MTSLPAQVIAIEKRGDQYQGDLSESEPSTEDRSTQIPILGIYPSGRNR